MILKALKHDSVFPFTVLIWCLYGYDIFGEPGFPLGKNKKSNHWTLNFNHHKVSFDKAVHPFSYCTIVQHENTGIRAKNGQGYVWTCI